MGRLRKRLCGCITKKDVYPMEPENQRRTAAQPLNLVLKPVQRAVQDGEAVSLAQQVSYDQFRRAISYMRVSVTDKCNLRCVYCMPEEGLPWIKNADILTYDEIERLVRAFAPWGLQKVRITGGEPLVRPHTAELVARLKVVPGIRDISLSTNGVLLADQAEALAKAGLNRVNISLDTLRPDRFKEIARRDGLDKVMAGIDAAIAWNFQPIKINVVAMRGFNDDELLDLARLSIEREVHIRFIEVMPVEENLELEKEAHISADEILYRLLELGEFQPVPGPAGNGPARYFQLPGAKGTVGVISPMSHNYCDKCNRVRLTANGGLRLCLFGDNEIDLRTPLRTGASLADLGDIFKAALKIKPERHYLGIGKTASTMRAFSQVGG